MNEANRKAQTRERVLEIAARQFRERGYGGAIREHLRTFHAYDEFWQRLLRQAVSRRVLRQGLDLDATPADWRHYATLEGFYPHRGNIDHLASQCG